MVASVFTAHLNLVGSHVLCDRNIVRRECSFFQKPTAVWCALTPHDKGYTVGKTWLHLGMLLGEIFFLGPFRVARFKSGRGSFSFSTPGARFRKEGIRGGPNSRFPGARVLSPGPVFRTTGFVGQHLWGFFNPVGAQISGDKKNRGPIGCRNIKKWGRKNVCPAA